MPETSAQRKLLRGIEQIKTLRGEAEAFEGDNAYVFSVKPEPRSAHEIAYHSFVTEISEPPSHWPLLAGEAIQNVRSALDHAVWSAWRTVPTNTGTGDHTQFPMALDSHSFRSQAGAYLEGVPSAIRTLIEETQPYRRLPQAPATDALYLLRTLSNIDKHRTLAAVACAIAFESTYSAENVQIRWEKFATGRELGHGETEVSVIVATSERDISGMEMNPHLTYQVRIEGRPLDFLPVIARRVYEAVCACETGNALTPFSAYPI
jgi:hypothetical protein